jgi:hypothetical protein
MRDRATVQTAGGQKADGLSLKIGNVHNVLPINALMVARGSVTRVNNLNFW